MSKMGSDFKKKKGRPEKKEQHAGIPGLSALDHCGTSLTRPCRLMQTKTKGMHADTARGHHKPKKY